ncbi:MAG TPA: NERD domain-containing protein [Chloroflexi bacterium]|nr:NERD domain-containing protein [Chloroflexota bacterium]
MKIIVDKRHIRIFSAIGQYGVMGGLGILFVGLMISFVRPTWIIPMMLSMALGFAFSLVGGFFADRYVGPLAHHKALDKALKGLDHRHLLLHYVLPTSHVLLEPSGCSIFVVKSQGGRVAYLAEEERWVHEQKGKFFRQFAGQEAIGAPESDARKQVDKLEQWLAQRLPDVDVPVRGVIVFVNPEVALLADEVPVPTTHAKKLKHWLRGPGECKSLPEDVYQALYEAFEAAGQ